MNAYNLFSIGVFCGLLSSYPIPRGISILIGIFAFFYIFQNYQVFKPFSSYLRVCVIVYFCALFHLTIATFLLDAFPLVQEFKITGLEDVVPAFELFKIYLSIFALVGYLIYFSDSLPSKAIFWALSANFFLVSIQGIFAIIDPSLLRSYSEYFFLNVDRAHIHGRGIDSLAFSFGGYLRPSGFYNEPSYLAPIYSIAAFFIISQRLRSKLYVNSKILISFIVLAVFSACLTLSPSVIVPFASIILLFSIPWAASLLSMLKYKVKQLKLFFLIVLLFVSFVAGCLLSEHLGVIGDVFRYVSFRLGNYLTVDDARTGDLIALSGLSFEHPFRLLLIGFGIAPIGDGTTNSIVDLLVAIGILPSLLALLVFFVSVFSLFRIIEFPSWFVFVVPWIVGTIFCSMVVSFLWSPVFAVFLLVPIWARGG
jgi:hypothetical protein